MMVSLMKRGARCHMMNLGKETETLEFKKTTSEMKEESIGSILRFPEKA